MKASEGHPGWLPASPWLRWDRRQSQQQLPICYPHSRWQDTPWSAIPGGQILQSNSQQLPSQQKHSSLAYLTLQLRNGPGDFYSSICGLKPIMHQFRHPNCQPNLFPIRNQQPRARLDQIWTTMAKLQLSKQEKANVRLLSEALVWFPAF